MNEQIKKSFIEIVTIWFIVGATLTIPAACSKALHSFYHQVVIKDQVVGQPLNK